MTASRHSIARHLAAAVTVVTAVFTFGTLGALAQESNTGMDTTRWKGTFDDMAAGEGSSSATTFTVTGTFTYTGDPYLEGDDRSLKSVEATITAEPECDATVTTQSITEVNYREKHFVFDVTSPCNQVVGLSVKATTTASAVRIPRVRSAAMSANITFEVPATPVTVLSASVPDIDSREVTVKWEKPEGSEVDTTYRVERQAPDSDEWTEIGTETELVDEIEPDAIGVYKYRVAASRPLVEKDAYSAVVEAAVGVAPTTTTTTTPGDEDGDAGAGDGDGTSTTVTMPDSEAPITVPRSPTRIGNRGVSTHTTVGTAPRSPVTTIDTGFEETLDYHLDDVEPGELAAEGQSILSTDPGESVIGPGAIGASALVLVGWAGHYLYFRRLAAQF